MNNPLFKQSHPFIKLIFLLSLMFVSFSFVMLAGFLTNNNDISGLKWLTALQQIFLFIVPSVLAAFLYSGNVNAYLYVNRNDFAGFVMVFIIMIVAVPLINYTGLINSKLNLPESLSGLEESLKKYEQEAEKLTIGFLTVSTIQGYLINLLIIAVLPSIGEELIFRGVLYNLFKEWTKNKHVAVLITAFIFSFIHFQFYGFLPRFLLGVLFGYLLVWSGSIWLPITAHFINNAFAVSFYYFGHSQEAIEKAEHFGTDSSTLVFLIFSIIILAFLLYRFYVHGKEHISRSRNESLSPPIE